MLYYRIEPSELDFFLELRETRLHIGRLTLLTDGRYRFVYDASFRLWEGAFSIGPSLSVLKEEHFSHTMFPELTDRVPSRQNPAFAEYSRSAGISPEEKDPMVLLAHLGARGPTNVVIERVAAENPAEVLCAVRDFQQKTCLSQRDLAAVFDVPLRSLSRLLLGKSTDKALLRLIDLHLSNPKLMGSLLFFTQGRLTDAKRATVWRELREREAGSDVKDRSSPKRCALNE